jgi:MFS transporter, SHS family, sialic acid transporter
MRVLGDCTSFRAVVAALGLFGMRATGAGLTYNAGRLLAAAGTIGSGRLLSLFGSYAVMGSVMSLIYLVGFVVIAFAPETKGTPLQE